MRLRLLTLQIFPQLPIMGYRAPFFWFTSLLCFNEARDYPIRLQCMRAVHCAQVLWPPNQLAFSASSTTRGGGSHQANDLKVLFSSVEGWFTCNCWDDDHRDKQVLRHLKIHKGKSCVQEELPPQCLYCLDSYLEAIDSNWVLGILGHA